MIDVAEKLIIKFKIIVIIIVIIIILQYCTPFLSCPYNKEEIVGLLINAC